MAAAHTTTTSDDGNHPIPAIIELRFSAAVTVEPTSDGLLAITSAAEPALRLLLSPESGWWLSLQIARATMWLREQQP